MGGGELKEGSGQEISGDVMNLEMRGETGRDREEMVMEWELWWWLGRWWTAGVDGRRWGWPLAVERERGRE